MSRSGFTLLTGLLLAACTASPTPAISPSAVPGQPVSIAPATPPTAPSIASGDIPPEVAGIGWVRSRVILDATGSASATHVDGGTLGETASVSIDLPMGDGLVKTLVAGSLLATIAEANHGVSLDVRDLRTGATRQTFSIPAKAVDAVLIDPTRDVAFASVAKVGGGLDIRRLSIATGESETLVTLDARFTPDGIPQERATLALDPGGMLLVDACTKADGCRLWEIPPGATAPEPRTLARSVPIVCSAIGATAIWLIVYDDAACSADTGDASLPIRAIDRRSGASHLVDEGHLLARRVVEFEGGTYAVASRRAADWSTSDILTVDVGSRATAVHLRGLPNPNPDLGPWLGVAPIVLPGSWVLVAPWGGETTDATEPPPARLLDLATQRVIELPPGTFGRD